ncbi:hypothetical protein ACOMHN_036402 [Nucella lapillus]
MYNSACVVNLHFHPSPTRPTVASTQGAKTPPSGTCCGILADSQKGLVLAHASCLSPLVENGDLDLATLSLTLSEEDRRLSVEVLLQREEERSRERVLGVPVSTVPDSNPAVLHAKKILPSDQDAVCGKDVRKAERKGQAFERFPGRMIHFFHCPVVRESLHALMPDPTWELLDRKDNTKADLNNNNNNNSNNNSSSHIDNTKAEADTQTLLSSFVIIRLQNWQPYTSSLGLRSTKDCCVGERAEICSTPFGGLKPEAFINSHSRGIVSTLAGKDNCLLLSDARCILGGEGAPLYTFRHSFTTSSVRCLTGVVIASLCWKNDEWVGFCVVCDISVVMDSALPFLHHLRQDCCPRSFPHDGYKKGSAVSQGMCGPEVVMLKVGSTWGSGVVVDADTGIVLTCSHVIKEAHLHPVEVGRLERKEGTMEKGRVLYRQHPVRHQFDLAVVQTTAPRAATPPATPCTPPLAVAAPVVGMEVFVVGHALFGAEHHLQPSVTSGVISKVIRVKDVPVMIQTTCAVHPGASGGALVDSKGRLLATVVCNTRDNSSGASFPHVNMSIPVLSVWPVISRFLHTRDARHLENLTMKNNAVDTIWALGSTQDTGMSPKASKL